MDKLKELLCMLEERLVEHDENRKEVQDKLKEIQAKIKRDASSLDNMISGGINRDFKKKEERVLGLIEKLNKGEGDMNALMKEAEEILSEEFKYEICTSGPAGRNFIFSYRLKVSSVKVDKKLVLDDTDKIGSIVNQLQEHLGKIRESMTTAQEELTEICAKRRNEAEELYSRINGELEDPFAQEDARIQEVVKVVKENIDSKDPEELKALTRKARLTLLKNQKYSLVKIDSRDNYDLKVIKEASLKPIDFEERKPMNLVPSFTKQGELSVSFGFFDEDEVEVLKEVCFQFKVEVEVWEKGHEEGTSRTFAKELTLGNNGLVCFMGSFTESTAHCLKMRIVHQGLSTQWSDEAEFTTLEFKECCLWKECPDDVDEKRKYSVGEKNPRIATKIGGGYDYCTIIGNTPLPPNKVTSWSIKILKSERNNGNGISIGVAPSYINQNKRWNECGWYFECGDSKLCSGPPHKYSGKGYGPRKEMENTSTQETL